MGYIHILTPEQISRLPAEYVAQMLEREAEQELRNRLMKQEAEALQKIDDKAVGMACKLFALPCDETDEKQLEAMTDEAWAAYDLLYHFVYEDWSEDDWR